MSLLLLAGSVQAATLIGWAELPADAFADDPTSGQSILALNGRHPPFINQQSVQCFSAWLATADISNRPTGLARSKTEPDNTEFILLKFAPLWN